MPLNMLNVLLNRECSDHYSLCRVYTWTVRSVRFVLFRFRRENYPRGTEVHETENCFEMNWEQYSTQNGKHPHMEKMFCSGWQTNITHAVIYKMMYVIKYICLWCNTADNRKYHTPQNRRLSASYYIRQSMFHINLQHWLDIMQQFFIHRIEWNNMNNSLWATFHVACMCSPRRTSVLAALGQGILWTVLIARFMEPTRGPSRAYRTQVGPMLAPWPLLSGWVFISLITRRGLLSEKTWKVQLRMFPDGCFHSFGWWYILTLL